MEEEVRVILRRALMKPQAEAGLGSRIHRRFAQQGGVDLPPVKRGETPRAARLGK